MIDITHYADPAEVTRKISKFVDDTESEEFQANMEDALQIADDKINNKLTESAIQTPIPKTIKRIAFFFAMVFLLDEYAMASGERNEIAIAWEKTAEAMLKDYPLDSGNEGSKPGQNYTRNTTNLNRPWTGSRTRGRY